MRKFYILLGLLGATMAFAQEGRVGINTENPNATLEVAGRPNNANVVDGFIAPKIDGPELRTKTLAGLYGEAQKGAIVYVTGAVRIPANRTGALVNVDSEGYYYFDGKVWVKFRPETPTYTAGNGIAINNGVISSTATSDNIYTTDGTLADNRVVTMDGKTLTFTGENTTFEKTGETISLKSLAENASTYIGFYKNGGTTRNGYIGYGSSNSKNLTLQNSLGDVETARHFRIGTVDLLTPLASGSTITLDDGSTSTTDRATTSQLGLLTLGANNIVRRTTGLELKVNSTRNNQTLNLNDYVSISGNVIQPITHQHNVATNVITLPETTEEGRAMGRIYQLKNSKSVDITTSVNYVGRNNVETNIIRPGQKVELVYVAGTVNKWVDISDKELPVGTAEGQTLQWNGTEWVAGTPTTYTAGNGITITDGVISTTAPADVVSSNIYTADGTLEGNRVVSMDNNTLDFAGGQVSVKNNDDATKALIAAADQKLVEYNANKLASDPSFKVPDPKNAKLVLVNNGDALRIVDTKQQEGKVLTSDEAGNARWEWAASHMNVIPINHLTNLEIPANARGLYYTGISVGVQPGKWVFTINLGVAHDPATRFDYGGTFLRLRLLSSEQVAGYVDGAEDERVQTSFHPKAYGSRFASLGIAPNLNQAVLTGTLAINNDTNEVIPVHIYADTFASSKLFEDTSSTRRYQGRKTKLLFSWNESTITSMEVK